MLEGKFIEETIAEKGFAEFYEQKIKPHVMAYEALRKKALWEFKLTFVLMFTICLGAFYAFKENHFELLAFFSDTTLSNTIFISFFIIGYLLSRPILRFKASVKEKIFPEIFSFFGDFNYFPKGGTSKEEYNVFNILPQCDVFKTQDLIVGKYKDVQITVEELNLTKKNNKSITTVFKGVAVIFSMNKNFQGRTVILQDRGKIGNFFRVAANKDLQRVTLEDPEFEKEFEVYAQDQIESRYLLTTAFMDRLLQVPKLFKKSKIEASFYNNSLFLAIACKTDFFEPGSIFKPVNFVKECKMIIAQMNLFFSIIDTLKLNQKTGL